MRQYEGATQETLDRCRQIIEETENGDNGGSINGDDHADNVDDLGYVAERVKRFMQVQGGASSKDIARIGNLVARLQQQTVMENKGAALSLLLRMAQRNQKGVDQSGGGASYTEMTRSQLASSLVLDQQYQQPAPAEAVHVQKEEEEDDDDGRFRRSLHSESVPSLKDLLRDLPFLVQGLSCSSVTYPESHSNSIPIAKYYVPE